MKAKITKVEFRKEYETKHGTMYLFEVHYDDKKAFYSSKSRDQKKFVTGQENEFEEVVQEKNGKQFLNVKPIYQSKFSPHARAVKKEQSRYSGFAMAYAKDLVVAGKADFTNMYSIADDMVNWMVETDKKLG